MSAPQTPFDIRSAVAEDAAEITRIYNHYIRLGGVTFDIQEYPVERIAKLLLRSDDAWFVAAGSDRLWGWASARQFSDRFGYRHSCETGIYLDDEAIGTDVGDLLQQRIDQYCVEAGIHHAMAKIVADNHRSLAFHDRYGYQLVGTQKEIGRIDDQWIDVVILQKIFE